MIIIRLRTLLKRIPEVDISTIIDHQVHGLCDESNQVKPDDIFFASKGFKNDGKDFIPEAIKLGAKTVCFEGGIGNRVEGINYLQVPNMKRFKACVAACFYREITKKVHLIGVTGTNGKTTVSTLITDFLAYHGIDALLVGTNGIFYKDIHFNTNNTTPSLLTLYETIRQAYKKGCRYVCMEVSSIGIRESRVLYFDFDCIIMTNLNQDHLDYHLDITDYKFSKALIMNTLANDKSKAVILNRDDTAYSFYENISTAQVITYGVKQKADYLAYNIHKSWQDLEFSVSTKQKKISIYSLLAGSFNVYNILAAMACVDFFGFSLTSFAAFLRIYANISGRMDIIKYAFRSIIVDFAHTPEGVGTVLKNLKDYQSERLTVIIGCGGNRDKTKRSLIGDVVAKYANKIIFTNDNPRDEEPEDIISDMARNLTCDQYEVVLDRKQAIIKALNESRPNEIIAILGKGCEKDQIIKGIKYPFSDKEVVKNYMRRRKLGN